MDIQHRSWTKRPQILTVKKKQLVIVLLLLGELSHQTRTKLHEGLKWTLGCCEIKIVFKIQRNISNVFRFKDRLLRVSCQALK